MRGLGPFTVAIAATVFFAFTAAATIETQENQCRNVEFDGGIFSICTLETANVDLRLFHADKAGQVFGHFSQLSTWLDEQGLVLDIAMNGGMYHDDYSPVGHYKAKDLVLRHVITRAGPGNFGMLPNGIFCYTDERAAIYETIDFVATQPECTYATQSGPLLVNTGNLHPKFLKNSSSRRIRNGVGVRDNGAVIEFVIANKPVNLHHFARLFRDYLETPMALYLEGTVARFHARPLSRSDFGWPMGPILGVVSPKVE